MQDPQTGRLHPIETEAQMRHAEEHKWPVFRIGEEVELKGGRFRIASFGAKCLVLEGLPGTTVCDQTTADKMHRQG